MDMQSLKITSHRRSAGEIVVFYAGNSLLQQVSAWADRHPACELRLCFAESLSDIRTAARRAASFLLGELTCTIIRAYDADFQKNFATIKKLTYTQKTAKLPVSTGR